MSSEVKEDSALAETPPVSGILLAIRYPEQLVTDIEFVAELEGRTFEQVVIAAVKDYIHLGQENKGD